MTAAATLQKTFPSTFGGYYLQNDNSKAVFEFTGSQLPTTAVADEMATVPGISFQLEKVSYSLQALEGAASKLQASIGQLSNEGVKLSAWGIDEQNNSLDIIPSATGAQAASDASAVENVTSGLPVEIVGSGDTVGYTAATTVVPDGSKGDTSPYYGGDDLGVNINGTQHGSICSSGFNFLNSYGVIRATTDGHCGDYNWTNNAQPFGVSISGEIHFNSSGDIQTISYVSGKTGAPAIWTSTTTAATVTVKGGLPQGISAICAGLGKSQAYDCAGTVHLTNQTIDEDGVVTGGMAMIEDASLNHGSGGAGGDSGSPIYQTVSGGVRADGLFTADLLNGNGSYANYYFAEPIGTALALVGCTLYTA